MPIAKLNDDSEFDALPRGHPQIVISSLTERGSHKMEILGYFQGVLVGPKVPFKEPGRPLTYS